MKHRDGVAAEAGGDDDDGSKRDGDGGGGRATAREGGMPAFPSPQAFHFNEDDGDDRRPRKGGVDAGAEAPEADADAYADADADGRRGTRSRPPPHPRSSNHRGDRDRDRDRDRDHDVGGGRPPRQHRQQHRGGQLPLSRIESDDITRNKSNRSPLRCGSSKQRGRRDGHGDDNGSGGSHRDDSTYHRQNGGGGGVKSTKKEGGPAPTSRSRTDDGDGHGSGNYAAVAPEENVAGRDRPPPAATVVVDGAKKGEEGMPPRAAAGIAVAASVAAAGAGAGVITSSSAAAVDATPADAPGAAPAAASTSTSTSTSNKEQEGSGRTGRFWPGAVFPSTQSRSSSSGGGRGGDHKSAVTTWAPQDCEEYSAVALAGAATRIGAGRETSAEGTTTTTNANANTNANTSTPTVPTRMVETSAAASSATPLGGTGITRKRIYVDSARGGYSCVQMPLSFLGTTPVMKGEVIEAIPSSDNMTADTPLSEMHTSYEYLNRRTGGGGGGSPFVRGKSSGPDPVGGGGRQDGNDEDRRDDANCNTLRAGPNRPRPRGETGLATPKPEEAQEQGCDGDRYRHEDRRQTDGGGPGSSPLPQHSQSEEGYEVHRQLTDGSDAQNLVRVAGGGRGGMGERVASVRRDISGMTIEAQHSKHISGMTSEAQHSKHKKKKKKAGPLRRLVRKQHPHTQPLPPSYPRNQAGDAIVNDPTLTTSGGGGDNGGGKKHSGRGGGKGLFRRLARRGSESGSGGGSRMPLPASGDKAQIGSRSTNEEGNGSGQGGLRKSRGDDASAGAGAEAVSDAEGNGGGNAEVVHMFVEVGVDGNYKDVNDLAP